MSTPPLSVIMGGRIIGDVQRTGKGPARLRYVTSAGPKLSLRFPRTTNRHRNIDDWLSGLLPDRPELLMEWRRQFGVADLHPMGVLGFVGEDVAGAASFVRADRVDTFLSNDYVTEPVTDQEVATMLRLSLANIPFSETTSRGKFSLAGVQAKIALQKDGDQWVAPSGSAPSTHIVKPPIPTMQDQELVEHVSMRVARGLGIPTAATELVQVADLRALCVTRYDRFLGDQLQWGRIHQEDMCQALGISPVAKYESQGGPGLSQIGRVLRDHSKAPESDCRVLMQAAILSWLTLGTDAHARNYSVLHSQGSMRLAPLYDLNSLLAYADGSSTELSMRVGSTFRANQVREADWVTVSRDVGITPEWTLSEIRRQMSVLPDAISEAAASLRSPVLETLKINTSHWIDDRKTSMATRTAAPAGPRRGKTSAASTPTTGT